MEGWVSWPRLSGNATAGNRTRDLSITSPTLTTTPPSQCGLYGRQTWPIGAVIFCTAGPTSDTLAVCCFSMKQITNIRCDYLSVHNSILTSTSKSGPHNVLFHKVRQSLNHSVVLGSQSSSGVTAAIGALGLSLWKAVVNFTHGSLGWQLPPKQSM